MGPLGQAFFGCMICDIESFFIILLFYYRLRLRKAFWLVYSIIILAINVVPAALIAPGERLFWANSTKTMFAISSISASISILTLGVGIVTSLKIDDDCIATSNVEHISLSFALMVIVAMIGATIPENNIIELETNSYENYYEITTEDGNPKVLYISTGDNTTDYYVVMYDSLDVDGQPRLNVVQVSPKNIDIVYAVEEQEKDYLIIYTTETIKEDRNNSPYEIISEKTYSYKLVIRKGIPIISVVPTK